MTFFQIAAVLFALFMMYVVGIHRRKSHLSAIEISFWYSTWSLFIVIALFPDLLLDISGILKFSRVFDLLTVGGMMILTIVTIVNYLSQKENNKKLEEWVRHQAILEAKEQNASNKTIIQKKNR